MAGLVVRTINHGVSGIYVRKIKPPPHSASLFPLRLPLLYFSFTPTLASPTLLDWDFNSDNFVTRFALLRRMGDHLTLLVDHLLTESTLQAAIGNRKGCQNSSTSTSLDEGGKGFAQKRSFRDEDSVGKLVECRICQEDDVDCNMEIPCSCCGSMKFAHRECVQRWCNEKGDTICEICLQQFKPGYTAPQKLLQYGSSPMNFRGNWDIMRRSFRDSQILALVPSERNNINSGYDDILVGGTRSTSYCQSVAVIFMFLLFLRHTLPLMITGADQYSFTLFLVKSLNLRNAFLAKSLSLLSPGAGCDAVLVYLYITKSKIMVLRVAGLLLLFFVMVKAVRTFRHHGRRQLKTVIEAVHAASAVSASLEWRIEGPEPENDANGAFGKEQEKVENRKMCL
ncbi:hypothetical protein ZIOFF_044294 [Zingiber officinale]|uniref:RING-CH-type domain-containing protein n=1 Tax=Zingiber officinale TaxID=94328 RepID=A0A8J5GBS6_ZINOF|nr:hypothetical protein ZIOFF_044294 [Zingiber officinale]